MLLKRFVDIFKQYKQLLNNKNYNYKQFLYLINFKRDLINQSNNK